MVAFLESRLDTKITRGAESGVKVIGRLKDYLPNGNLHQSFLSTKPVHYMDLSHGLRSRADFQVVLDLFYIVMFTPYIGFRAKDWRDFIATQLNTKVTLIFGTSYQLQRKHAFGGIELLREITKPVSGTVVIYNAGGTPLTAMIDYTTGIATVPSGTPATWSGEFDVPVTFTDDAWTSTLEVHTDNLHVMSGSIKLEEVRPVA